VLLAPLAGPAIYTALIVLYVPVFVLSVRIARRQLGPVRFRSRSRPVHWLFLTAAAVLGFQTLDVLVTDLFSAQSFNSMQHILQPVLAGAMLSWGVSRLQIRDGGLVMSVDYPYAVAWADVASYDWTGRGGRKLVVHLADPKWYTGRTDSTTVRPDERDAVDALLGAHVARRDAPVAAPADS
jgi:hypothetical protein